MCVCTVYSEIRTVYRIRNRKLGFGVHILCDVQFILRRSENNIVTATDEYNTVIQLTTITKICGDNVVMKYVLHSAMYYNMMISHENRQLITSTTYTYIILHHNRYESTERLRKRVKLCEWVRVKRKLH